MGTQRRDEWLRDVEARQRNVVFPDTVRNENAAPLQFALVADRAGVGVTAPAL